MKKLPVVADYKNLTWLSPFNISVAGYLRTLDKVKLYCVFNFSDQTGFLTWAAFKQQGLAPDQLYDHWNNRVYHVGPDHEYLIMPSYTFNTLEVN